MVETPSRLSLAGHRRALGSEPKSTLAVVLYVFMWSDRKLIKDTC